MNIKEKIMKNKEAIYNKTIFIIEFLVVMIFTVCIFKIGTCEGDFNNLSKKWIVLTVMSSIFILAILIFNVKKYKNKVEKLFVTFIIPVGMLFAILFPASWVPDENGHMYKAYDISCGNIITPHGEGNRGDIYVPQDIENIVKSRGDFTYKKIYEYLQQDTNYENTVAVQTAAKTYCPINYLTGAITFAVCRTLDINMLLAWYIIKIINFILFIVVAYYAIKIIPFGKLILAIYMFLPMIIQQACSLSADTFINNIALLFIAYNLKLVYQENNLKIKQILFYISLAISLSISKFIYFPLVFLSLLLIKNKNISRKNRNILIIVSITISILVSIVWFLFSQSYVETSEYLINNNVVPSEQIKNIIKNPINYIYCLIKSIIKSGYSYITQFVGQSLGWLDIDIPSIYAFIMITGLILLPFFEENKKSFQRNQKIYVLLIVLMLTTLILTGLYLTFTPVGDIQVRGVQGRYFVPVFILILFLMIKGENIKIKNLELKYFITYIIINILTFSIVFEKFI